MSDNNKKQNENENDFKNNKNYELLEFENEKQVNKNQSF